MTPFEAIRVLREALLAVHKKAMARPLLANPIMITCEKSIAATEQIEDGK